MSNVTVSIVSHGHDSLVKSLLSQLIEYNEYIARVIITHNIQSKISFSDIVTPFEVVYLRNEKPLGFGENHNRAFKYCHSEYYCVMNPDIILKDDPFKELLGHSKKKNIVLIAPVIENIHGEREDSARYFPTPFDLLKKLFGNYDGVFPADKNKTLVFPEWVGGMFMLIKHDHYHALSGFDSSYFLYYEDVDFCLRTLRSGHHVTLCQSAVVVHDARRDSHRDFKFLKWHISSALRFFIKYLGRFPKVSG